MVIQQNRQLLLLMILIVVGQCLPKHGSDTSQWLSNRTNCYCYLRYSLSWVNAYLSMVLTQINGYPTEPIVTVTYDTHCRGSVLT